MLTHRRLPLLLAILAIGLTLPALWTGWHLDDHFHRLALIDHPLVEQIPLEIYSPVSRPGQVERFRDDGLLPWWTPDDFRIHLLRVLSAASLLLDSRLWPDSPALWHLQSLIWFGALIFAAGLLFRRMMAPASIAGLAALLYAVDEAHALPAAWLANRNALLATFFGILCLLAHDRWRREEWKPGALWSAVFLIFGLLSGEMALGAIAYLIAYSLFIERQPGPGRWIALLPAGAVFVVWALVYRFSGFGAHGSGVYLDPAGSPVAFLQALWYRAPLLLMGHWTPIPSDWATFLPPRTTGALWLFSLTLLVLLTGLLIPLLRRSTEARFWATGMLLAIIPVSATFPSNRLLFFVGLGGMALMAMLLERLWRIGNEQLKLRRWMAKTAAGLLILFHLILAPLLVPVGAYSVKIYGDPTVDAVATVPNDPSIAGQDLVLVNSPDHLFYVSHIPTLKLLQGKAIPRRLRALSAAPVALSVTRLDERTITLEADRGLFFGPLTRLFRSADDPLLEGDRIQLTGLLIEVMAVEVEGDPLRVQYTFSVPLEDPSLRWLQWADGGYAPFPLPLAGQTIRLPAPHSPFDILYTK